MMGKLKSHKKQLIILSLCGLLIILFSFQADLISPLKKFALGQQNDYKQVTVYVIGSNIKHIENRGLHSKKEYLILRAKKSHTNKNSYNKKVNTVIGLSQFEFANENKCKQAQDSILNCFPNDCFKIERQISKVIKITPSIFIFNQKEILIGMTNCEHVDEKWSQFIINFTKEFAEDSSEIILTECGKLFWTNKQNLLK